MKAGTRLKGHEEIEIRTRDVSLKGYLAMPEAAGSAVIFAHGSGSGRHSPRNQLVAGMINRAGMGTLLFDLLSEQEEAVDALTAGYRFDISLLTRRLEEATDWLVSNQRGCRLAVGYFGASTGAAAALSAAARKPDMIGAVVSRGGRPDMAGPDLERVKAATLLIVGGEDTAVIELNSKAYDMLKAPKELSIVPGATHLFEEPGTLEEAGRRAVDWFSRNLVGGR